MSCNCSRYLIAINRYDEEGRVTTIGVTTLRIILHQKPVFQRIHPIPKTMKELKTMIRAYHEAGIVVIDVIYNPYLPTENGPFQNTVPGLLLPDGARWRFQNGTGVGNETASEHEMYRKYMIDSLTHWVNEYQIDGFR